MSSLESIHNKEMEENLLKKISVPHKNTSTMSQKLLNIPFILYNLTMITSVNLNKMLEYILVNLCSFLTHFYPGIKPRITDI